MQAAIPFPDIRPEIFTIPLGGWEFSPRWYALAYIVGILIGWWLMIRVVRAARLWPEGAPITRENVDELVTWMVLSIVLGGRLGYVLFYKPEYYSENPLEILKVWEGGMSFHGGMLGVVIGAMLFAWRFKVPLLTLSDLLAVSAPAGLLLGRIANFINGELWGRPTDLPWGVIFRGEAAQDCGPEVIFLCARHPSQLYEAGLEGLVLGLVLLWLAFRTRALMRPGLLAGIFFIGYGLARFTVEFFRVADAQFISPDNPLGHVGGLGLSMGQLLSLPMIAIGIGFVLVARRNARA